MFMRHLAWLFLLFIVLLTAISTSGYFWLNASLPLLDGKKMLSGLSSSVNVERDHAGVPMIAGKDQLDVAQALGFVHGQERFFQMDLSRRAAAGELSELVGNATINYDKRTRIHRLRTRAERLIDALPSNERTILARYARGVNQGLESLSVEPFEYTLLQQTPRAWDEVDSLLVVFSMYLTLQESDIEEDDERTQLKALLPADIFEYLTSIHSPWLATLDGVEIKAPPIPSSQWPQPKEASVDSPQVTVAATIQNTIHDQAFAYGSNNWAVSGDMTAYKSGMLANDMHLGIDVPNIWFRTSMSWSSPEKTELHGVTLPGIPALVVGSNTHIAWGFTNSYGDLTDTYYLTTSEDKTSYFTGEGEQSFTRIEEIIKVKGEAPVAITVIETQWGPVINPTEEQWKVIHWMAYSPNAINMTLLSFASLKTVTEALDLAPNVGIPTQNLVVTDTQGNIGWTLMGPLYKRVGYDGRFAIPSTESQRQYRRALTPDEYPYQLNPASGKLWTANAAVLSGPELATIGLGPYAHSARSQRIQQMLNEYERFDEATMMQIQLDTTNHYFAEWKTFLIEHLARYSDDLNRKMQAELRGWSGKSGDVAGHIIQAYQFFYQKQLMQPGVAYLKTQNESFSFSSLTQYRDIPYLDIVKNQPDNLLPDTFDSWQAFHQSVNQQILEYLNESQLIEKQISLAEIQSSIHQHPLSTSVPLLGLLTDMPSVPLGGSKYTINVDNGGVGASERLVVAPGHEDKGILQMPSSQTGHPLSPYYMKAHEEWSAGIPSPLLPQATVYKLVLVPSN